MKKMWVGLLLLVAGLGTLGWARDQKSEDLFVVIVGDKRGFIDGNGTLKIKPQFDGARDFSEGLAVIATSDHGYKEGYIDESGKIVIPPQFDAASDFSEGLAAVGLGEFRLHGGGDHRWGFVDRTGTLVIKALYPHAGSFSEGLAGVQNDQGKWGYINQAGQVVIPYSFAYASRFSEGLACVMVGKKFGFINHSGKLVIPPFFNSLATYSEGLALVRIGGKSIHPLSMEGTIGPLGGRLVYLDQKGKEIIRLGKEVKSAHSFSEGLAAIEVIKKDGYLYGGYIDKTGKLVISPEFGHVEEFSEGLALILLDGKWGYIDKTGKLVFKTGFDQAESFRNGRAWVQEGGTGVFDHQNARYGYIDRTGKVIWPPSN